MPMKRGTMEAAAADFEFLPVFRTEAEERLDTIEATLRRLDPNQEDAVAVESLVREAHTIKGAAGMVGLMHAHHLAHALEDVLRTALHDGGALGRELIEILLRAARALREAIYGQEGDAAPLAAAPPLLAVPEPEQVQAVPVASTERPKVLVVDDSLTLRRLQEKVLERAGYRVTTANDGMQALEVLAEDAEIGLLVTDVDMPELDGFGLVEAVRADGLRASMPVVIVTARDADEDRQRGLALGADEYVVKGPLHEQTLLETVGRLVSV
jgi:CheY-like chemotaxis protein/HPt (histidine-containing phosphotransfer) domain-containing protein